GGKEPKLNIHDHKIAPPTLTLNPSSSPKTLSKLKSTLNQGVIQAGLRESKIRGSLSSRVTLEGKSFL
ncbi:hypothetical protein M8C21_008105, partial [Ambrosia artemisiifolia]